MQTPSYLVRVDGRPIQRNQALGSEVAFGTAVEVRGRCKAGEERGFQHL